MYSPMFRARCGWNLYAYAFCVSVQVCNLCLTNTWVTPKWRELLSGSVFSEYVMAPCDGECGFVSLWASPANMPTTFTPLMWFKVSAACFNTLRLARLACVPLAANSGHMPPIDHDWLNCCCVARPGGNGFMFQTLSRMLAWNYRFGRRKDSFKLIVCATVLYVALTAERMWG